MTTEAGPVRAPRGAERSCRGWAQEAALRMLMNNLDPEVAEDPDHLVVYGGTGKAARDWASFDAIVRELEHSATTRRCSSRAGSRSASSGRTSGHHASCSPIRTSSAAGRRGISSASSSGRA